MPRGGTIKWNRAAFEEIRRMPGVEARVADEVSRVLGNLGEGYEGGTEPGATRVRGYVVTAQAEAIIDNSENQSLLRALGGGSA